MAGRITRFDGTKTTLSLKNAARTPFELSARQKFLARIVQPDVFFVLLILGVLGLVHRIHASRSHRARSDRRHLPGPCAVRA